MTDARPQLVVLFGGQSAEHDVSCVSARHVIAATDTSRYDVRPIGITRDGRWVDAVDMAAALLDDSANLPPALVITGPEVDPTTVLNGNGSGGVIVFPVLHGPMGEDGTIQGLLDVAGVPYVGCGVLASAIAMDKSVAKEVFAFHGIPQARWTTLGPGDVTDDSNAIDRIITELGLPVFVKPANMGSSIGISKARNTEELEVALKTAGRFDEWIICEEAVIGREIECAVLGNSNPNASLPGEVIPGAEFYDYEDKYSAGKAQLQIPAHLPAPVTDRIRDMAIKAYRALRCEGMARVDFFYEADGRGLLVNEVNTIPGFTPISMYPRMWEATGLSYSKLINELIRLALERNRRRNLRSGNQGGAQEAK